MDTIEVRFIDIKRWVASQLTGLALTILGDDVEMEQAEAKEANEHKRFTFTITTQQDLDDIIKDLKTMRLWK